MTLLNRNLAPIDEHTWELLDEEAREYLPLQLTGRKLADVTGPLGSEAAALNTGRIEKIDGPDDVSLARRLVQPLIEIRVPFTLNLSELENYSRGAEDVDVDSLQKAADRVAAIEDGAIFSGLEKAGIKGIKEEAEYSLTLSDKPEEMFSVIIEGINSLFEAGISGPFALVLDDDLFKKLYDLSDSGYPLTKRLADVNIKKVNTSPGLDKDGLLLSIRGGDFELALGEDLSIGFKGQNGDELEFFFAESFTSRVLTPEAAIVLN